jgi:glycosyltransferase involved in cell wall biosynthesis
MSFSANIAATTNANTPSSASRLLRVSHVVFSLEPGGMENGVVNVANHLPAEFQTRIVCLEKAGAFAARLRGEVQVSALGRRPGWDWSACHRLGADLRLERPHVIHTHNVGPLIYAVVARALSPRLWRVPILHGEHGALQGESLEPRRLRQRRRLYRFCRIVHTVSEGLRLELIERGLPGGQIVSVLNGVDCRRFVPREDRRSARCRVGLPEDAVVLGSVGRFIATKRYPMLIETFEILAERHPQLHLVILGDGGPERDRVMARIGASPQRARITAAGHQADPAPWYQAMDLMVMPSSHEGLANALLEAMASGVPALAHSACGAGEVIEDETTGFLRHMDDSSRLASEVGRLLELPERLAAVGQAARAAAVEKFSLDSMVENYGRLYLRVAR